MRFWCLLRHLIYWLLLFNAAVEILLGCVHILKVSPGKFPEPLMCVLPTPGRYFHERLVVQVIVRHASGEECLE